jgi:hypothetical protein
MLRPAHSQHQAPPTPRADPIPRAKDSHLRRKFDMLPSRGFNSAPSIWYNCLMDGNLQSRASEEALDLRRQGGRWLRERREAARLSQRQLAERVGVEYYTFVSQLEAGHGRISPRRYRDWAMALSLDPGDFVTELLRYYDPITYDILFQSGRK